MIRYSVQCATCGRMEPHGSKAPLNPDSCNAARAMRAMCREVRCRFNVAQSDFTPDDLDALRLGMREEKVIV